VELIPERGEIWRVALNPSLGSEVCNTRPCVVGIAIPSILVPVTCDCQPAVAVRDQIRAVAKERLRAGIGTLAEE